MVQFQNSVLESNGSHIYIYIYVYVLELDHVTNVTIFLNEIAASGWGSHFLTWNLRAMRANTLKYTAHYHLRGKKSRPALSSPIY